MNEKILKWIIGAAGIICLYGYIAIRHEKLFNLVLVEKTKPEYWENVKWGELYYFNYIADFREQGLPDAAEKYRHTNKHPDVSEADILIYGDSYMDFSRMVTFPERLGDTLGKKVFYYRFFNDHTPLSHLLQSNYRADSTKILIYESAERYISFRFTSPHELKIRRPVERGGARQLVANIRDNLFLSDTEVKFTALLSRSVVTSHIYSFIQTLKFRIFGYIPTLTPVYALGHEQPWLFYHEEVSAKENTGFYYQHSEEEMNAICDHIADLATNLKEQFNLQMVFLPIPSKYTIYHKLLNDDPYNMFLPRLYKGLEERGVAYINLYDVYRNSDEILYYGTDTHWNKSGLDIAVEKTVNYVNQQSKPAELFFARDISVEKPTDLKP